MSGHTPGPWVIQYESCDCELPCSCGGPYPYKIYSASSRIKPYRDSVDGDCQEVCDLMEVNWDRDAAVKATQRKQREADARLIAAAPDLLEALEHLASYRLMAATDPGAELIMPALVKAKAAIRRAKEGGGA